MGAGKKAQVLWNVLLTTEPIPPAQKRVFQMLCYLKNDLPPWVYDCLPLPIPESKSFSAQFS